MFLKFVALLLIGLSIEMAYAYPTDDFVGKWSNFTAKSRICLFCLCSNFHQKAFTNKNVQIIPLEI